MTPIVDVSRRSRRSSSDDVDCEMKRVLRFIMTYDLENI